MKAVVLVGGEGTRMRPLTETVPKPLLPLMDRHALDHVLDHLARHGVHEVVLSSPYLEKVFHPFIEARHGDPAVIWITETHALGTGGAIVHALDAAGDEPFFALNGDILTDLDLTAMKAFHEQRAASVTIALHHVDDARAFGLVATGAAGVLLLVGAVWFGTPLLVALVAFFVLMSAQGLVGPNAGALASAEVPEHPGTGSAILGFFQWTMAGVVAPIAGLGGEESAVPMAVIIITLTLVSLVALLVLARGHHSPALPSGVPGSR